MGKKVLQFDLKGNFIREYPALPIAAEAIKISHKTLTRHLKGQSAHAGGYIWKWSIPPEGELLRSLSVQGLLVSVSAGHPRSVDLPLRANTV